jgi:hypothetical protein
LGIPVLLDKRNNGNGEIMTLDAFILSSGGGALMGFVGNIILSKFTMPKNGSTPMTKDMCGVEMKSMSEKLKYGDDRFSRIEEKIDTLLLR